MPQYIVTRRRDSAPIQKITADNDAAALAQAKQHLNGVDLALWAGGRLIAHLPGHETDAEVEAFAMRMVGRDPTSGTGNAE